MIEITKGSGNVYADLHDSEATTMQIKASLASMISDIVRRRRLTQQKAAELMGLTQPKLSEMLRGQFRGISEVKMIGCLNNLGRDVEIVVRKRSRKHAKAMQRGITQVSHA